MSDLRVSRRGDPEIAARTEQYELAYRMQASIPDLADISDEPESVLQLYGPDVVKPGTYARNCLVARRLAVQQPRRSPDAAAGLEQSLPGGREPLRCSGHGGQRARLVRRPLDEDRARACVGRYAFAERAG